jgi:hypothetical protein
MANTAACDVNDPWGPTATGARAGRRCWLTVLVLSVFLFAPPVARLLYAHGDHGDAAPPEGGVSLVSFDGFQAELLTFPRPPRAGEETKIVIKIVRDDSFEPVRNGVVLIAVAPAALSRAGTPAPGGRARATERPQSLSPIAVHEVTWAGNYTLATRLQQPGAHVVRVVVGRLGQREFDPPRTLEFYVNIAPPAGVGAGLLALFVTAAVMAIAALAWAKLRVQYATEPRARVDLLAVGWLNRFVRWNGFQTVLQLPVLAITAVIVLLGFFDIQDGSKNLATKLTWIVWWPGIVFTFILAGRLWCVVCPFGVINELAAKWSKAERLFPRALRGLWVATALFVLLTWADEQLGIIRSPRMTAALIVLLSAAAVATGLYYQRRSFCRYLCPITGLQGVYSMMSPVELRAVDRSICGKECRQSCYRGTQAASGCPMLEFPMSVDRNNYCNFCFECVKTCPTNNIALRFRPFGADLWSSVRHTLDESYLALALVGVTTIVTAQMLSGWGNWISALSRMLPLQLRMGIKPVTYLTLTETMLFILVA